MPCLTCNFCTFNFIIFVQSYKVLKMLKFVVQLQENCDIIMLH